MFRAMSKAWASANIPSQRGKRVVVTGATSGIGWNTALELVRAGAEVIIPARLQTKTDDAVGRIRAEVPDAQLKSAVMDLTDLASVRAFADEQLGDARPIDTLVDNAGVMAPSKRKVSVDGFELQCATNVLGHFLLTGLLLPSILRAPAPRVVTVSSYAHTQGGPVPVPDLNSEQSYKPVRAYSKTKLENVLFARELQRRAGALLLSTACHPGYARTNLQFRDEAFSLKIAAVVLLPFSHNAAKGAEPTLFAATALEAKPAGHYGPGGLPSVPMTMRQVPPGSLDPQARKDSLIHAHAPSTQRDRGGWRQRRRPEADGRGSTRLGLSGIIEPPQAPNVHCR